MLNDLNFYFKSATQCKLKLAKGKGGLIDS